MSCAIKYLNQKCHETIAESRKYELNEYHVHHMMCVAGGMEKIQNDFNCLFFQSGKKSKEKALISVKMLLFLKTIWPLVLVFQLPGSVFGYDNEDCQDHQSLVLKHQDIMQITKYSLKIKQIY